MPAGDLFIFSQRLATVGRDDPVTDSTDAVIYGPVLSYAKLKTTTWVNANIVTLMAEPAGLTPVGSRVELWEYVSVGLPQFGPRYRPLSWLMFGHVTVGATIMGVVIAEDDPTNTRIVFDDPGLGTDCIVLAPPM